MRNSYCGTTKQAGNLKTPTINKQSLIHSTGDFWSNGSKIIRSPTFSGDLWNNGRKCSLKCVSQFWTIYWAKQSATKRCMYTGGKTPPKIQTTESAVSSDNTQWVSSRICTRRSARCKLWLLMTLSKRFSLASLSSYGRWLRSKHPWKCRIWCLRTGLATFGAWMLSGWSTWAKKRFCLNNLRVCRLTIDLKQCLLIKNNQRSNNCIPGIPI